MTAPLLSACIVVTDEVHDVHACLGALQQLRPLLSEICVYGVAASERVLDFARKAGATVTTGDGEHDVAVARNNAAAMTNATWVLVVEPGEKVIADIERLQRLLAVEPGMMAQPDALSIQVRAGSEDKDRAPHRQVRIYRPEVARFDGAVDPKLVPVAEGRKLTILTPGREVVSASAAGAERDPVIERARLERRIERANATVADLEKGGVGGDDLVTALVDRARLLREIDEDNAALADLTRARTTRATQKYRWRARQELASLLIKQCLGPWRGVRVRGRGSASVPDSARDWGGRGPGRAEENRSSASDGLGIRHGIGHGFGYGRGSSRRGLEESGDHLLGGLGERLLGSGQVGLPRRRVPDLQSRAGTDDGELAVEARVLAQGGRDGDAALLVGDLVGGT